MVLSGSIYDADCLLLLGDCPTLVLLMAAFLILKPGQLKYCRYA
jgi:hypothetical protein